MNDLNVGDQKQVKGRKTRLQLDREHEIGELRAILGTYGGRSFLWRLLSECGIYKSPVTHALETFRQLGRGDIGRWTIGEIFEAMPEAYTKMRVEAEDRHNNETRNQNVKGKTDD